MCVAASASELFCVAYLTNIESFYITLTFHFKCQIHVNSPARTNENQLKWEKVRFLLEMSEIKLI